MYSTAGSSSTSKIFPIRSSLCGARQADGDAGSVPGRAFEAQVAAVVNDDAARQHDPEAGAVGAGGEKRSADARQHLGSDAGAAVGDDDLGAVVALPDVELDTRAGRAGLDRVLHEVDQRLLEPARVGDDRRAAAHAQADAGRL